MRRAASGTQRAIDRIRPLLTRPIAATHSCVHYRRPFAQRAGCSFGPTHWTLDIQGDVSACHRYGRPAAEHNDSANGHRETGCGI